MDHHDSYQHLEQRVAIWGKSRPDIQAVLVVGSRARQDMPADEFSDLDLVLFAVEPAIFIDDDEWPREIGPVVLSFVEGTAVGGWRERRAVFSPMLDVDFAIVPSALLELDFAVPGPVTDIVRPVIDRGFRIVYDDSGKLARLHDLPATSGTVWVLPDQAAFTNLTLDFWYHAMWTTKKVLRGEILVARSSLDDSMKDKLLKVINWLAHLGKPGADTWHGRRFFERWSDQDIVKTFHATYGTATLDQILGDLSRTMDLFSRVAHDAATRLGYAYPEEAETHIRGWIRETVPDTLS